MRGEMIDIGGRRLHLIRQGPKTDAPTVLLEAGAFGFSADWGVVQDRLAADGLHALSYDRAGLGASDPGPRPRDGAAIIDDLEKLLAAADEPGPFIYVGHSMAGLFARLFANRNPDKIVGLVLVDAVTPEATDSRTGRDFISYFVRISRVAPVLAKVGLYAPLSAAWFGDKIGLTPAASAEKRHAFASALHNRWSSIEVDEWMNTAQQAKASGTLNPDWPVAVVTAGRRRFRADMEPGMAAPADQSRHGYVDRVDGATHTTLLGAYVDAIVCGVEHVRDASKPPQ